jgi:Flp pilus assembly protein TadD
MPRHRTSRNGLAALALALASGHALAMSPSEVFDATSPSVVMVFGLDAKGDAVSLGSGVALAAGEVITNCHVVKDSSSYSVKYRKQSYPATLKLSDWDRDVCGLSVAGLAAKPATLGATRGLKVGQRVYAIGAPEGFELTLSEGIVSSLRDVEGGQYIQTTAPISPGSSGGGLFDEAGRLIGLPTFYHAEGQQLNFAVPVEWVKELPKRHVAKAGAGRSETEWLNRAIELENRKDWPALIEHGRKWTQAQPRSANAWFALGFAYRQSGQTAKAIEAYEQALRIDPDYVRAWSNLGVTYARSGQTAKAIEAGQQALRIDPDNARAWYGLGVAHEHAGQTAKAIEAYQQAVRIDPDHAVSAWNSLGRAYVLIGQTAKAIEAFQQAVRIDPKNARAWSALGAVYKVNGQRSRMMEVYRRLKTVSPEAADEFFSKVVLP